MIIFRVWLFGWMAFVVIRKVQGETRDDGLG
jgi:hypothetical protein